MLCGMRTIFNNYAGLFTEQVKFRGKKFRNFSNTDDNFPKFFDDQNIFFSFYLKKFWELELLKRQIFHLKSKNAQKKSRIFSTLAEKI